MKRYSRKRDAILDAIRQTDTHPTAEWIYAKLKPEFPDLSLATVYRNIKDFASDGEISSLGTINSKEHFDGNITPHSHFICDECGSVFDVSLPEDCGLASYESDIPFGKVTGHTVTFHGVCNQCLKTSVIDKATKPCL
jgi:Fur family peroxide stress response transcriptional regulator